MKWVWWLITGADWAVLKCFDRGAAWIQRWTGWDCLDQSSFCFRVAGVLCLAHIGFAVRQNWIVGAIASPFFLLGGFAWILQWPREVTQAYQRFIRHSCERGYRNHRRDDMELAVSRLVLLLFVVPGYFLMPWWITKALNWACACGLYLGSADPQPPQRGKIGDWWHAFSNPPPRRRMEVDSC